MIWGFEKLKLKEESVGFIVTESMTRASVLEFSLHLRETAEQKTSDDATACALEPKKCLETPFIWDKNVVENSPWFICFNQSAI